MPSILGKDDERLLADILCDSFPRKCERCKDIIRSPQAVGAHMKKRYLEMCKPKPMAVGLFEMVIEKVEKLA